MQRVFHAEWYLMKTIIFIDAYGLKYFMWIGSFVDVRCLIAFLLVWLVVQNLVQQVADSIDVAYENVWNDNI